MVTLQQLLKTFIDENASDMHLVAGAPPVMRVSGRIIKVKTENLKAEEIQNLCYSVLTDEQKAKLEEHLELDMSFGVKKLARFRLNLFFQRGALSAVFRRIPHDIPNSDQLGLPRVVVELTQKTNGLILVTGPTGSGKSSTIAALIDKINREQFGSIITIEDPIEFLHEHKNCVVSQREVGSDTKAYNVAIRHLLRQDPDYCLIGEIRDLDTMDSALRVAETGHLVFSTLHTNSAIQTISRVVSLYHAEHHEKIRGLLSQVLQGVVSQQLIPAQDGSVALAMEVLIPTPGVRNLIRENKMSQIYSMMQVGQNQTGMITMNQSILSLLLKRTVSMKSAFEYSPDPEELDTMLRKAGL